MPTDTITLQIVKNAGAPATGAITAAFSDAIVLKLASSSGVRKVKYRIREFPEGFALPSGWTQDAVNIYSVTVQNGGDAPSFSLPASGNDLRGKYFFDAVANDQMVNGSIVGGLLSKAALQIPMATAGLEDLGFGETNEFDSVRQYIRALKKLIRVLDQAVLSGGGVTAHALLTGLANDDHTQYEFARRPLTTAYTAASNDAALLDARKCIITTRATAISLRIRLQATIAWLTESLLGGINTGAGTLTLTAEGGVTLNGSVTVPANGWWWAKRTASNVWQVFTGGSGGGGGTGDFKADGTVVMTGALDFGTNKGLNLANATNPADAVPLSQTQSLIASAIAGVGGGSGDGFVYTLDASTTDADPTAGKLRLNNATLASVTQIFIDLQDADGNDTTGWLDRIDDAFGTAKGYVRIGSRSDRTKWVLFKVTGLTTTIGYRKIPVTHVSTGAGGGPTTTASDTFFSFEPLGFEGTVSAAQGGTGVAGAGGTPNRVLRTSDGSTWTPGQVAAATDISGVLPLAHGGSDPFTAGTLTGGNQTINIGTAQDWSMAPGLTSGAAVITVDPTLGSPVVGEVMGLAFDAQGDAVTVQNGGTGYASSIVIPAGSKYTITATFTGADFLIRRLGRRP